MSTSESASTVSLLQLLHNERMQRQRNQPLTKTLTVLVVPSSSTSTDNNSTSDSSIVLPCEYRTFTYKTWPGNAIGSIVWEGTLALLAFLENVQYPSAPVMRNTNTASSFEESVATANTVLELGSGIGLLSIGFSMLFSSSAPNNDKHMYITDHKDVLPLLEENIQHYLDYCQRHNYSTPSLHVLPLSWGKDQSFWDSTSLTSCTVSTNIMMKENSLSIDEDKKPKKLPPTLDCILAADVIYEPVSAKLFIETLDSLIPLPSVPSSSFSSIGSSPSLFMAYKERGVGTYFFQLLQEYQFRHKDITPPCLTSLSLLHYSSSNTSSSINTKDSNVFNKLSSPHKSNVLKNPVDTSTTIPWPYTEHRIYCIYR